MALAWFIMIVFLVGVITIALAIKKAVTPKPVPLADMEFLIDMLLAKCYVYKVGTDPDPTRNPVYVDDRAISNLITRLASRPEFDWTLLKTGFSIIKPTSNLPSHVRRYSRVLITPSNYYIGFNLR